MAPPAGPEPELHPIAKAVLVFFSTGGLRGFSSLRGVSPTRPVDTSPFLTDLESTLSRLSAEALYVVGRELLDVARVLKQGGREEEGDEIAETLRRTIQKATVQKGLTANLSLDADLAGRRLSAFRGGHPVRLPSAVPAPPLPNSAPDHDER